MPRLVPIKKQRLLRFVAVFLAALTLIYYFKLNVIVPRTGSLKRQEILDRKLLFHETPPDVRSCNIEVFDSRFLIVAIERLLAEKSRKLHHPRPQFFTFENIKTKPMQMSKTIHFAFVGDSRIRQLFTMFMTAIPSYDRRTHPSGIQIEEQHIIPNEMVAYSELQGVIASYYWRSLLIDDDGRDLSEFFDVWLKFEHKDSNSQIITPHPDVLVIGISAHHMLREHTTHERGYFKYLKKLVTTLRELSKHCRIIWLNQYPTQEFYGANSSHNTDVHASKIWHYNQEANKILRNGGIDVWNSGSPIVEEYIRSCMINRRQDNILKSYFDCTDYIHPGTSALTDVIQLLYNLVLPTGLTALN